MNQQETQQAITRDEKWVSSADRVKISSTNLRLETTVPQKEETFQVVIDIIKNSTRFKAFTISADVLEIFMQQFWYTIKKVQGIDSYEFLLSNKKCRVNAEVFRKILDICPRVEGEEFTELQNNDDTLTFLIYLGYKGPLHKYTSMYVDYMSQPWRTLAAIINKCLSGKTASNERLRKSRIDIIWGMFYKENVDYPELIWSLTRCSSSIPLVRFPPRRAEAKVHKERRLLMTLKKLLMYLKSLNLNLLRKKTTSRRVVKKKVTISADDNIIPDLDVALELGKSISLAEAEEEEATKQVHATHERIMTESAKKKTGSRSSRSVVIQDTPSAPKPKPVTLKPKLKGSRGSTKGTGTKPGVPDESTVVSATSHKGTGTNQGFYIRKSDTQDTDDEDDETESDEDKIYKYKIRVRKYKDEEMLNTEVEDSRKGDAEVSDAAKADAEKTEEAKDDSKKAELPPTSSSLSISSGFDDQFLKLSSDTSLVGTVKDTTDAEISLLLDIKIQSELRVVKLEKDVSELKKIDHSEKALATLKSQVPIKYSVKPAFELSKIQTPTEKSASKILKIKREQAEKQKMPKYAIKSTNKAALKELYHALMKAFIEDENAIDKGVADTGKKTKRRRTKESESSKKPSSTKETPKGKAPSKGSKTSKSTSAKEPVEEPITKVVMDDAGEDVVHDDDQPQDASKPKTAKTPNPEWFTQPQRLLTPDPEWNKCQVILGQPEQPWFNEMVFATKDPLSFNDLMDTPIDFSKYVLNRLKIDNLTQDILLAPSYNLLKGTCYPGHLTIAADYFFNNDLEYLKSSDPERTYTTSITKIKVARYEIVGIEDMIPTLWSPTKVGDGVKKLHGYGHLEEIVVKRDDRQLYKFKEGDFVDLHLNDIEDMLLFAVQHKLFHLNDSDIKKLNITPPQQTFLEIEFKELYTPSHKPPGVIYEDLAKQQRVMWADELYKFLDGTLKKVRDEIHHRVLDFRLEYNDEMSRRNWTAIDRKRSQLMVELIDKGTN
ncbi:hypothetical protein Tco_0085255 [Tanacetum coccineum]